VTEHDLTVPCTICGKPAAVVIDALNEKGEVIQVYLCHEHFRKLVRGAQRVAKRRGVANVVLRVARGKVYMARVKGKAERVEYRSPTETL